MKHYLSVGDINLGLLMAGQIVGLINVLCNMFFNVIRSEKRTFSLKGE